MLHFKSQLSLSLKINYGTYKWYDCMSAQTSGTTVTFMIIEGWVITVASVGDSRCVLESAEGGIYYMSADHRLECDGEE